VAAKKQKQRPPSRVLLVAAGALTQLVGAACLVLALASLPAVHDAHRGMSATVASAAAAAAGCVCGYLVYYGRIIPLALALVIDVGFGIVLPRGDSVAASLARILPPDLHDTVDHAITAGAVVMFATAVLCALAIPSALALRRYERAHAAVAAATDDVPRPADTAKGMGVAKMTRTQVIHVGAVRSRPLVIAAVALTLTAVGAVVILSLGGGGGKAAGSEKQAKSGGSGSSTGSASGSVRIAETTRDGGVDDAAGAPPSDARGEPSIDDFVGRVELAALAKLDVAELGPLFATKSFAFGVEANEVAEGRDAIVKMLRHDLGDPPSAGFKIDASKIAIGREKSFAWIVELVDVAGKRFTISQVVALQDNAWRVLALHWAVALANETAYAQARTGELPVPDAIPDHHDSSTLAQAMRKAFGSKATFVTARATRADAVNVGSAPGERILGGDTIRRAFARLKATIALRGAVAVGSVDDGGWGAANVDFTDADKDGTQVTQTFRVLAAFVRDGPDWRIVQTQWSNGK
jgi:hypothetical protein